MVPDISSARQILKSVFGYDSFRPGQERAIEAVLEGTNVLAVMPTGSGKSLCFQIPALVKGGLAVVVSPLLALMQDQVDALRLAGVAADTINSSKDRGDNVAAWRRVAAGETRLLYLSPERLMTERMLSALSKLPLSLVAVDEAHCISQWGPAFRPDYEALSRLPAALPRVPIMAMTATADEATRADIALRLFGGKVEEIVLGFDRPNISLAVTPKKNWKAQLVDFVKARRGSSGIVYCLSRKKTEEAAALLAAEGIRALPYHAGMTKEAREANQNAFMTEPHLVMVATIAFGMGIDKSDVRFVFHTDLPASPEAYYQEIGRAGRDGEAAEAHMLFGLGDIRTRRMFIDEENSSEERKRREHQRLDALLSYCEASSCRRAALLSYFGERIEPCGNCDVCSNPSATIDGTKEARQVLAAVLGSGERYGAAHIVDVLRGAETEKVTNAGHQRLSAFGMGAAHSASEWRALIRQMVSAGLLVQDVAGFGGLSIGEEGKALLKGAKSFAWRRDPERRIVRKERVGVAAAALGEADAELLAALKQLRLKLARERGVPAYLIFSDKSLIEIARHSPQDLSSFAMINGVGRSKLHEFGQAFIEAIAAFRSAAL
jgi:ATP-dependent DNA helicase RecQ